MCAKSVNKKKRKKSNRGKVASLAEQNARKSMNRSDRAKQKRQQAEEKLKKIVERAEVAKGADASVVEKADGVKAVSVAKEASDDKVVSVAKEAGDVEIEEKGTDTKTEKESVDEIEEASVVDVEVEEDDVAGVEVEKDGATGVEAEQAQGEDTWGTVVEEVEGENKRAGKIDDKTEKRRHKLFPILWWMVGVLVLIAAGIGGFYLARSLMSSPDSEDNETAVIDEDEVKDDGSEKEEESPVAEEPPAEEKPVEEPPVEEKPPVETPVEDLPPIAPRPGNTEQPEVVAGQRVIALTFDDGPSAVTTPRLLDILGGRNVKATFFVLGTMAERSPGILQREAAEGHEVASHTPYHDQLTALNAEQVRWQALEMDRIFTNILGTVPPFTRPPYGLVNDTVREALGQPLIMWSIDPKDWQDRDASIVCSRVVGAAFDGAIILVHDIHATTVDAVPCIIDNLRSQGYEFLTVSEMAAARDVPLVNGQIYYSFR